MFALYRSQNYVLVNVYSLHSCDEHLLSTPINICVQLRTNNYQHVPAKKIGLYTCIHVYVYMHVYVYTCIRVHVYVRSQDRHKFDTSQNIVSRVMKFKITFYMFIDYLRKLFGFLLSKTDFSLSIHKSIFGGKFCFQTTNLRKSVFFT
jgi:hypothetical protein